MNGSYCSEKEKLSVQMYKLDDPSRNNRYDTDKEMTRTK